MLAGWFVYKLTECVAGYKLKHSQNELAMDGCTFNLLYHMIDRVQ